MDTSVLILKATNRQLTEDEVADYARAAGITRHEAFDALVESLARGFVTRELSFSVCDTAVNEIFGLTNYDASEFTWSIYGAFEEGEGHHPGDAPDLEPSEIYVRPLLEQILAGRITGQRA